MLASALPQLVRAQAASTHYSVSDVTLPYTPGIDGVGYTDDGKLVYVNLLVGSRARGEGFAEWVVVDERAVTEVSVSVPTRDGDGASDGGEEERNREREREVGVKVAALVNPALSSWMAMKYRANIDEFGDTRRGRSWSVLVLGATSASGRMAALFARRLGAARVIGVARDAEALGKLKAKAVIDESIVLDSEDVRRLIGVRCGGSRSTRSSCWIMLWKRGAGADGCVAEGGEYGGGVGGAVGACWEFGRGERDRGAGPVVTGEESVFMWWWAGKLEYEGVGAGDGGID